MNRLPLYLYLLLHTTLAAAQTSGGITIHAADITLKDAFDIIEKQTAYTIAYRRINPQLNTRLSLALDNATIDEALGRLTKGLNLTYKIKGYHIIVLPQATADHPIAPTPPQKPTQTIRGRIADAKTGNPVGYATVGITDYPTLGATTDDDGNFTLPNVPVGRYNLKVSCIGYEPHTIPEVLITSSKEVNLSIQLDENVNQLAEVVVYSPINKEKTLNPMAALIIRGNSPLFTQWRLEGVEIPNPNHFADIAGLGGGFLSALSTHVIGNSDFLNGAFPAEYDNALSGVFDMHIRNGNKHQHEHTLQIGQLGIDIASEGPLSKKHGSSYLFNYRFSDTRLTTTDETKLKYQDLSFKLNFPTRRLGTFSLWGLALIDGHWERPEPPTEWETLHDRQSFRLEMTKYVAGLTHRHLLGDNTYIKSTLAITHSNEKAATDQLTHDMETIGINYTRNKKSEVVFNSYLNKQYSPRHINRTGITLTGWTYELDHRKSPRAGLNIPMQPIAGGTDENFTLSAFTSSVIDLTPRLSASIGLSGQFYSMNRGMVAEPRLALKWKFNANHSLAASYGLHSKRERLSNHFIYSPNGNRIRPNKHLGFSKAHHFGLSYNWNISPDIHLKVEPYYQSLFNIPVESGSSFSIINDRNYFMDRTLTNQGKARNYGIDFTLERYLRQGYYYMGTLSLFKSTYRGGDLIWRPTRMDRNFIINLVGGKEWMVGKRKQNMLNINMRLSLQGGERYTPVDEEKSHTVRSIEVDETKAFTRRFHPCFMSDFSASYKINRTRMSHEFAIKLLNVNGYTGTHFYQYNEKNNSIKKVRNFGMIPNISYRIQF